MSKNNRGNKPFQSKPTQVGQGTQSMALQDDKNEQGQAAPVAAAAPAPAGDVSDASVVNNTSETTTAGDGAPETAAEDQTPPQGDGASEPEGDAVKDVTFENGAGETAQLSALATATVSQIETADMQSLTTGDVAQLSAAEVKSIAPVVEDKGVQDKSVATPPAPPAPPAPAPVAKAPVAAVAKTDTPAEVSDFDKFLAKIEATGSAAQKALVGNLSSYLATMKKNRPVTAVVGATQNQLLWLALFNVIEKSVGDEFRVQWNIVLNFFEQYKNDAFGPRHVHRFAEAWTRDPEHLQALQRLINLIHLTSNRAEREDGLKRVDLGRTLAHPFTEEGRSRIMGFYNK